MSVTTTTENESFELQESAPDGSRKPSTGIGRSRTKPIATQRAMLIVPPLALALVLLMSWFVVLPQEEYRTLYYQLPEMCLPHWLMASNQVCS